MHTALPDAGGALVLDSAAIDAALADVDAWTSAERELRALHTMAFMQALHGQQGAAAQPLLVQLAGVAARILADPARLRDAFAQAGFTGSALKDLLGAATSHHPVVRNPNQPSALDIRLKRR